MPKPADLERILKRVLPKVKPSAADEKAMQAFVSKIMAAAQKACGKSARPLMVGSVEKGTWLSGKRELDLFLLFPASETRERLEKDGLGFAEKIIKSLGGRFQVAYAEHPYLKGSVNFQKNDYSVDVVPAFDVPDPSKIKSAVDRTPHHVIYVKNKLNPLMNDQARLLKAFAKAAGAYGADVKTQGFSGYLCELLVIKYGSFLNCVNAAKDWNAGLLIDLEGKWKSHEEALGKFRAPLVFIDPVDPNRNVAAAVSPESFYKFTKASREFLSLPNAGHFFPPKLKPYSAKEMAAAAARRGARWYLARFPRPDGVVDDVMWPQLRRASAALETVLSDGGFRVLNRHVWAGEKLCAVFLELDVWQVPKVVKHTGPSVYSGKQARAFLEHYSGKKAWVEKENWVTETERAHTVALPYIRDFLSKPAEFLESKGIPNKLSAAFRNAGAYSGGGAIKEMSAMPESFGISFREFLERDLNVA